MGVAEREDEGLDTEQELDTGADEGESHEGEEESGDGKPAEGAEYSEGEGGEGETVVSFGSEEPPASEEAKTAPQWVKDLRERQRQLARENAELRAKLGNTQQGDSGKPVVPAKPKLADYDFDEEKYEQARDAWEAKKREAEAWEADQRNAAEAQQKRVQAINEQYAASTKALGVKDYQEAEDEVAAVLDQVQQSILKAGASNPGALVYALGRTPKKLADLASIKDPVKFAVAVGKLETEVKVTKRSGSKPAPETAVRGGGGASTSQSKGILERLRAEADKTGDRSKVVAYLRQQRQAGQK